MADEQNDQTEEKKQNPCCEDASAIFSRDTGFPAFCPSCGTALKKDHDPKADPFPYQCPKCCDAVGYRKLTMPDEDKSFCPNCGEKHGGEIRWPKGFMSCCGGF